MIEFPPDAIIEIPGMSMPRLTVILTDDNEWLKSELDGFGEVVISYDGEEHVFAPGCVIEALDAVRRGELHGECGEWRDDEFWCEYCDEPVYVGWAYCPGCGRHMREDGR